MSSDAINKLIDDRVDRKRKKLIGYAVTPPSIRNIGGQDTWVVDVLIAHNKELMKQVTISENNRQLRNFVTENTPVEIERSPGGQFYISGLSNKQKGFVSSKTYSLADAGLAFSQGYKIKEGGGGFESGNGNEEDLSGSSEATNSYTFVPIPYGDLSYGVDAYGAKTAVRT